MPPDPTLLPPSIRAADATRRDASPPGRCVDLTINVSDAARLGGPAEIAVTIVFPDPADLPERPVVAFAKPGGGYSRGYFTHALPGPGAAGSQAAFHAAYGWIFVAVDHIATRGAAAAPEKLGYMAVTTATHAAERQVLDMLAAGTTGADFPPVRAPLVLGIGHSMGGAITIVQQARFLSYDGVAILGFSAVHSHPAVPPGEVPVIVPWTPRDSIAEMPFPVINEAAVGAALAADGVGGLWRALAWGFYHDDVPHEVVTQDIAHLDHGMTRGATGRAPLPPWSSAIAPGAIAQTVMTPGIVAPEAAAVTVPVLCAMGERDMIVDPLGEPRAFKSAPAIDLFVCPRMGHIHNLASTRALLWRRIELFGAWCAAQGATRETPG